jgi:hypothetical protein
MITDGYGLFHDEFMICKMNGIEYVEQITIDKEKIQNILQNAELKRHAKEMKESRRNNQQTSFESSPIKGIKANLFGDDEDADVRRGGGKKKRTYKKRSNKKRKTSKRKAQRKR